MPCGADTVTTRATTWPGSQRLVDRGRDSRTTMRNDRARNNLTDTPTTSSPPTWPPAHDADECERLPALPDPPGHHHARTAGECRILLRDWERDSDPPTCAPSAM